MDLEDLRRLYPPAGPPTPPISEVTSAGFAAAVKKRDGERVVELGSLPPAAALSPFFAAAANGTESRASGAYRKISTFCRFGATHKAAFGKR